MQQIVFFVLVIVIIVCLLIWARYIAKHSDTMSPQEADDIDKIRMLNAARAVLKTNSYLLLLHNQLIELHASRNNIRKDLVSKNILKIIHVTKDVKLSVAICALAQMAANKKIHKQEVKDAK